MRLNTGLVTSMLMSNAWAILYPPPAAPAAATASPPEAEAAGTPPPSVAPPVSPPPSSPLEHPATTSARTRAMLPNSQWILRARIVYLRSELVVRGLGRSPLSISGMGDSW